MSWLWALDTLDFACPEELISSSTNRILKLQRCSGQSWFLKEYKFAAVFNMKNTIHSDFYNKMKSGPVFLSLGGIGAFSLFFFFNLLVMRELIGLDWKQRKTAGKGDSSWGIVTVQNMIQKFIFIHMIYRSRPCFKRLCYCFYFKP